MNLWTEIACEITRKCGESALYFSIRDTEFGENITHADHRHRSTKGYIICTAVAKLRAELFPEGHQGPSAKWYYPDTDQPMCTISRRYLDWMDFQGVQLMYLDIHTAREVLTRTTRSDGMEVDVSSDPDCSKPMKRIGET